MPEMIAQGDQDDLMDVQRHFVAARCAAGQRINFRTYAGHDHMSVLASDSPLLIDLIEWTRDRFAGQPASANCPPA